MKLIEPEYFEDFWEEYPRKVGKKMARIAWGRIKPNQQLSEKIIKALYNQNKAWTEKGTEMDYIPHASTWLNQERWEDEIAEVKTWGEKFVENMKKEGHK